MAGCFITGTDTGVGKTVVTAALALCLTGRGRPVGVMKPVETGFGAERNGLSDAERLTVAAGAQDADRLVNPYRFSAPLAPMAAASLEGATIELGRIVEAYRRLAALHGSVLVEGAGGLLVPLTDGEDMRDLIERLALPVLLVGRSGLGGVNHALLSVEALRARKIPLLALVLNRIAPLADQQALRQEAATVEGLRKRSEVPVIGPLPYCSTLAGDWESGLGDLAKDERIAALADLVSRGGS